MADLWHLQLSWEGIAANAKHYYATLKCHDKRINCLRELGPFEVDHLNGSEGDGKFTWEVGMEVGNYDSREDAIYAATHIWTEVGSPEDLLLLGHGAQSFNKALAGPQGVLLAISVVRERYLDVCGTDERGEPLDEPSDWSSLKHLYQEWDAILKPFKADSYKLYTQEKSYVIKLDGTVVDRDAEEIQI